MGMQTAVCQMSGRLFSVGEDDGVQADFQLNWEPL